VRHNELCNLSASSAVSKHRHFQMSQDTNLQKHVYWEYSAQARQIAAGLAGLALLQLTARRLSVDLLKDLMVQMHDQYFSPSVDLNAHDMPPAKQVKVSVLVALKTLWLSSCR